MGGGTLTSGEFSQAYSVTNQLTFFVYQNTNGINGQYYTDTYLRSVSNGGIGNFFGYIKNGALGIDACQDVDITISSTNNVYLIGTRDVPFHNDLNGEWVSFIPGNTNIWIIKAQL